MQMQELIRFLNKVGFIEVATHGEHAKFSNGHRMIVLQVTARQLPSALVDRIILATRL